MSRVTKADLEKENQELKDKINDLYKQIEDLMHQVSDLREQKDNDFSLSSDKMQLEKKIILLEQKVNIKDSNNKHLVKQLEIKCNTVQELINENEELKRENEELKANASEDVVKKHNERNAGRKKKVNDDVINRVISLRKEGKSFRAISKEVGFSVGTVQNILHDYLKNEIISLFESGHDKFKIMNILEPFSRNIVKNIIIELRKF